MNRNISRHQDNRHLYHRPQLMASVLAGIMLLGVWTMGCSEGNPLDEIILIPTQDEIRLGHQVHEYLVEEFGEPLPASHPLAMMVAELGSVLGTHTERPNIPLRTYVLHDPLVNAFAGPGGFVYVTTGLIGASRNAAELIGVIAHEIGHVSRGHSVKRLQYQLGASYLTDIIFGRGAMGDVLDVLVNVYLHTGYSQKNEFEADAFAVKATGRSQFNPYGLVKFFEFIRDEYGESPRFLNYVSSHPSPSERIQHAQELINAEFPQAGPEGSDRYRNHHGPEDWDDVKDQIPAHEQQEEEVA